MKLFINEKKYEEWKLRKNTYSDFVKNSVGLGFDHFKDNVLRRINWNKLNKDSWVVLVNDYDLTLTNEFIKHNITNLVFISTNQQVHEYYMNAYKSKLFQSILSPNFKNNIFWKNIVYYNITKIDKKVSINISGDYKIMTKYFDLVVSNPPYCFGNEITDNIVKNVKFDTFINLMPISDYKKNKLYQHIEEVGEGILWLGDADVLPFICILSNNRDENISWDEIQLNTYDQKWIKYYKEQLRREASWETYWLAKPEVVFNLDKNKSFLLTVRTGVDGVHKTQDCLDYKYNILKNVSEEEYSYSKGLICSMIFEFNSQTQANNIKAFWYNSQIMSSIVKGLNKQSLSNADMFLPKVDWSHPWTDEEILKDYGYTEEEIQKILRLNDDLNRLKKEDPDEA